MRKKLGEAIRRLKHLLEDEADFGVTAKFFRDVAGMLECDKHYRPEISKVAIHFAEKYNLYHGSFLFRGMPGLILYFAKMRKGMTSFYDGSGNQYMRMTDSDVPFGHAWANCDEPAEAG